MYYLSMSLPLSTALKPAAAHQTLGMAKVVVFRHYACIDACSMY